MEYLEGLGTVFKNVWDWNTTTRAHVFRTTPIVWRERLHWG